ncbi:MAG: hypothetical protein U5K75_09740 [Ahrensia sp.]|nr:hypothetical protein [Ahrensia sp.]
MLKGGDDAVFSGETDFEVANQPDEFWQGDPVDVMQRIADIAGWKRRAPKEIRVIAFSAMLDLSSALVSR